MESDRPLDDFLDTQAMVELTEANVSPVAHQAAWETEIASLRQATARDDDAGSDELDRVLEEVTLLA